MQLPLPWESYKLLSAYPPSPQHDDDRDLHLYPQGVLSPNGDRGSNPPASGRWPHPLRLWVSLTSPSPNGEGFFLLFYLLSFTEIVFYLLTKVDGHMSRGNRNKCPVSEGGAERAICTTSNHGRLSRGHRHQY
jgi:hypothetical protein